MVVAKYKMVLNISDDIYLNILNEEVIKPTISFRAISKSDIKVIGHLMYDSYLNSVDYDGETINEACEEVENTFNGKYGAIMFDPSLILSLEKDLIGSTIFGLIDESPVLLFLIISSNFKRQGFGKLVLLKSLSILSSLGYDVCNLYVSSNNIPAIQLYQSIGFKIC